jgi:hypothetical protein
MLIIDSQVDGLKISITSDWYTIAHDVVTRDSYITLMMDAERHRSFNEFQIQEYTLMFPRNWILS